MILVGAMREVETSNVHPCLQKLLGHFHGSGSRTQRTHYFGLGNTPVIRKLLQDPFYVYVRHSNSRSVPSFTATPHSAHTHRSINMSHETQINKTNNQTQSDERKTGQTQSNLRLGQHQPRSESEGLGWRGSQSQSHYLFVYLSREQKLIFVVSKQQETRVMGFLCLVESKSRHESHYFHPLPQNCLNRSTFAPFHNAFLFKITFVFTDSYKFFLSVYCSSKT